MTMLSLTPEDFTSGKYTQLLENQFECTEELGALLTERYQQPFDPCRASSVQYGSGNSQQGSVLANPDAPQPEHRYSRSFIEYPDVSVAAVNQNAHESFQEFMYETSRMESFTFHINRKLHERYTVEEWEVAINRGTHIAAAINNCFRLHAVQDYEEYATIPVSPVADRFFMSPLFYYNGTAGVGINLYRGKDDNFLSVYPCYWLSDQTMRGNDMFNVVMSMAVPGIHKHFRVRGLPLLDFKLNNSTPTMAHTMLVYMTSTMLLLEFLSNQTPSDQPEFKLMRNLILNTEELCVKIAGEYLDSVNIPSVELEYGDGQDQAVRTYYSRSISENDRRGRDTYSLPDVPGT